MLENKKISKIAKIILEYLNFNLFLNISLIYKYYSGFENGEASLFQPYLVKTGR